MRILQVSSADEFGGGEQHLVDLVNGLSERGHEVHVVLRPQSPLIHSFKSRPGIQLYELPLRNALDFGSSIALAHLARKLRVDVVHAHVARDYPICARATRSAKVPFVVTRHHFNPLKFSSLAQFSLRNVAYLIAVSAHVSATLCRSLPKLASRVRVIPNWIGASSISPLDRIQAREKLGISQPLSVGIVGKISPLKGQALFVDMARRIAGNRAHEDVEFVIAGLAEDRDREYEQALRASVVESGLEDRIRFTGFVNNIAELMTAFDIVVVPSQNEAFSLVVAEAMAARAAVVGAYAGGIRILLDGERGVLVSDLAPEAFETAVSELLNDPDRRREIGEAARKWVVANHDRDHLIDQIEQLYRTLA